MLLLFTVLLQNKHTTLAENGERSSEEDRRFIRTDSYTFASLINLVRSRWLDIGQIEVLLFFPAFFIDQDEVWFFATSELMLIDREPLLMQHTHTI